MSIVSAIGNVINKMSVASAIDYHIAERNFANLLKFNNSYQVFIDAPLISEGSVNSGVFLRTYQVKMLWLKKMTKGSTYTQHYDNGITPMRTLVKEFVLRLNNEKSAITNAAIFEPVLSVRETDLINLFDENTSGVLIEFNLKVIDDGSICTPNVLPAPSVFIFADQTTVTAGTEIRLGWIAFSVDNITIDNGIGEVSAIGSALVTINNTITYTATATNSSGTATDSITILVSNGCDDATAVLKDEDGNTLSTTNIPSGNTEDIIAPDGTVTAVNSDNSFSQSQSVLSGGTANLNLPDITVNESDGTTRTQPSVTTVTCIPQVKQLRNKFNVLTGQNIITYTITADEAGTITSVNNGGLTSFEIKVNTVTVTAPFVLANADMLEFTFDAAGSNTQIILTGTYV